jgi:hypothetical protein
MKFQNLISNIPSISSGGSATFNLPIGIRYHGLNLFLSSSGTRTSVTSTNFTRLRITIDTVVLVDWDWTSLQNYALRRGISLATGQIPLYFADPILAGLRNAYAGTIDTKQNITNVQVYVLLGTITSPSLTGELIFDNMPNIKRGANGAQVAFNTPIIKTTQQENIPSGNYTITDISNGYPLDTLTLYNGADAQLTYIRTVLNNNVIFEGTPSDLAREFLSYGIYTPAGTVVLPFTYDRMSPTSAAAFTTIAIYVTSSNAFTCYVAVEAQLPSLNL